MAYVKHYKKRTIKNKLKFHTERITFLILALIGLLYLLNEGIEYLKSTKVVNLNIESVAGVVEAQAETVPVSTLEGLPYVSKDSDGDVIATSHPLPSLEKRIAETFPEDPETMLAIAKAESRLNPNATHINTNGTIDCGVFQINSVHGYDCEWLKDPDNNLKAAREVYEKQGLFAWTTFNYAVRNKKPI